MMCLKKIIFCNQYHNLCSGYLTESSHQVSSSEASGLSPPVNMFLLTVPRRSFFVDHLCYLCLVFVMLSRLFIAALWSPAGKGLTSWLLFVVLNCVLSFSHVVSWIRCGT